MQNYHRDLMPDPDDLTVTEQCSTNNRALLYNIKKIFLLSSVFLIDHFFNQKSILPLRMSRESLKINFLLRISGVIPFYKKAFKAPMEDHNQETLLVQTKFRDSSASGSHIFRPEKKNCHGQER